MKKYGGYVSENRRLVRHHYCTLKAHRVRGRNTENSIIELDRRMANCQQKWYVVMKFIHDEKHIVFQDIEKGRRKKEILDGVVVVVALSA